MAPFPQQQRLPEIGDFVRFLPIVRRELLAASRRKSTHRARRWTAFLAILVSLFFLLLTGLGAIPRGYGLQLFQMLVAFSGGLAFLSGALLTSDSLSREKRDGTIGLLFLTDLKGYDVVFGKLIALSLNAFYCMLALLPVAALSLLLGGVTGGEFWRASVALLNGLFFSVAAGTLVSSLTRQTRVAVIATVILMLLFVAGLPLAVEVAPPGRFADAANVAEVFSPYIPIRNSMDSVYSTQATQFWVSLLVSHLCGWTFLGAASWLLPHIWQETGFMKGPMAWLWRAKNRERGHSGARDRVRTRLLQINPLLWLVGEEPMLQRTVWGLVICWGTSFALTAFVLPDQTTNMMLYGARLTGFLFKMLLAFQACRFFAESRQSGGLELLLTTPLHRKEIITGQWLALRRIFLWPAIFLVFANLLPIGSMLYRAFLKLGPTSAGKIISESLGVLFLDAWFGIVLAADSLAVCWLGMWLALTVRKPELAASRTILFALILPSVGICGIDLVVDLLLILWSATKLHQDFRWIVTRPTWASDDFPAQHKLPPRIPIPPVITARS